MVRHWIPFVAGVRVRLTYNSLRYDPDGPSDPDPIRGAIDVMFCLWARDRFPMSPECRETATNFAIYVIEHQDELKKLAAS